MSYQYLKQIKLHRVQIMVCVFMFQILYAVDGTKTKKCLHTSTCTTYLVVGIMYQLLLQS